MSNYTMEDTLAYALRHKPDIIGIFVNDKGWASVNAVYAGITNYGHKITKKDFLHQVQNDPRKRFSFDKNLENIRANYGHTLSVKLELEEKVPPTILYHGTTDEHVKLIMKSGEINKMNREYVYLSADEESATKVGERHGEAKVVTIFAKAMYNDGCKFALAPNGVWLTDSIPIKYILY